jgi:hypothetical protein
MFTSHPDSRLTEPTNAWNDVFSERLNNWIKMDMNHYLLENRA